MLKKLCTLLLCFTLLTACYLANSVPVFASYANSYQVYFSDYSNLNGIKTVKKPHYFLFLNKKGESCVVQDGVTAEQILSDFNATIVRVEQHCLGKSIYAYSGKIKYKKRVFGCIVNLHIEISDSGVRVGSPIIYGSF